MMNIQLAQTIEAMPLPDLEAFINEALQIRARRISPSFNINEAEVLLQIGQGLSPKIWQRYALLNTSKGDGDLSDTEIIEMIDLSQQIECYSLKRLQLMTQLATIRKVSLQKIANQLGVGMPKYV